MKFNPKSADEIAEDGLLPDGDYDFTVQSADEAVSKAGNEMIKVALKVFDGTGGGQIVYDYLVSSDGGLRKIRGFAVACGILADYEAGRFEATGIVGQSGRVKIKRDNNPGYEPKNAVAYYLDPTKQANGFTSPITRRAATPVRQMEPAGGQIDDEIPF